MSGEQKVLVALDDGRSLVPVVVAFEKNVVDGVEIPAMRAGGVVSGIPPEAEGIAGVKCVAGDDLKGGRLVCARLGCEDPRDERVNREVGGFSQQSEVSTGVSGLWW